MFTTKFGIEIELSGIDRKTAAQIIADYFNTQVIEQGIRSFEVKDPDGRIWKILYDGSIRCERKVNGRTENASADYAVEIVSPILTYQADINKIQEIVRLLRKAGGFGNNTTGIHLHIDKKDHTPKTIRNFINIIASKNDLFYKALAIEPNRAQYCKKIDQALVEKVNAAKPQTFEALEEIWYDGFADRRETKYHKSRYCFLNLHSLFHGCGTIELRGFNSELHAGKIRSYIVLALALNNQALKQKYASPKKNQEENERFAMRTYLNRIGLIGEEFKACREHLCTHLSGSAAWRYGKPNK